MSPLEWTGLLLLGLSVGTIGALIGVGGGFILVPILMVLYPGFDPVAITSISLAMVLMNGLSALIGYLRLHRVDIRSGVIFSLTAIPTSAVGTWVVSFVSRQAFSGIFGTLLILISVYLGIKKKTDDYSQAPFASVGTAHVLTDALGQTWHYHSNVPIGLTAGLLVGFFSGFSGIGGGILLVPILTQLMGFPMQIATATSVFMLVLMTLASNVMRGLDGALLIYLPYILPLSIGAIIGAQLGVRLARKAKTRHIVWILAGCMLLVGIRTLISAF